MRLWHFTSTMHLPFILQDGALKPSDSMLDTRGPTGPECVWLLDTPHLDHSHGLQTPGWAAGKTGVKFEVEIPDKRVVEWLGWAESNQIEADWLRAVLAAGGGPEAAKRWRCVFRSIPRGQWVSVSIRQKDGSWKQAGEEK